MATPGSCTQTFEGIGNMGCVEPPVLKMIRKVTLALESQSFASLSAFKLLTNWNTDIAAKKLFTLPEIHELESANVEEVTSETSAGYKIFHRNGRYGLIMKFLCTPDQNRILQSYNNKKVKAYLHDDPGACVGCSATEAGTTVQGFSLAYFHAKPMELPTAADGINYAVVEIQFKSIDEFNKRMRYALADDLNFNPIDDLKPMTKITLTAGTVAANAFTLSAAYFDPTNGKSTPLSFDAADLEVINQAAAVQTVTLGTETIPGTRVVTATSMTSGTVELLASATSLYYSDVTAVPTV